MSRVNSLLAMLTGNPDANQSYGGQFGGLPQIPQMSQLDAEQALSAAMENHDFNGAVARQDASGRAYFADPTVHAPVDGDRLAMAKANLAAKMAARNPAAQLAATSPGGAMPGGPTSSAVGWESEAPKPPMPQPPAPAVAGGAPAAPQPQGGVDTPSFQNTGLLPQSDRQALVTARAQSRGLQRDFRTGEQTPQSMLLSKLQGDDGADDPMMAGMMFGPQGYAAQLKAQGVPDEYAQQMAIVKAKLDAEMEQQKQRQSAAMTPEGVYMQAIGAGATPEQAQAAAEQFNQMHAQGAMPGGSGDLSRIAKVSPTQQDFYKSIQSLMPGITQQEADLAWIRAGKPLGHGGMFSSPPSFTPEPSQFDKPIDPRAISSGMQMLPAAGR